MRRTEVTVSAGSALKDAAKSCVVGGKSFTATALVLLGDGKAIPISSLKPGQKVLATNTTTGQTRAEAICVVIVHYDTNLYDLKIRASGRTAVIGTTSNHPIWDATTRAWTDGATLHPCDHLRTPAGQYATVIGGRTPTQHDSWMWDLTIPGDHDFYVVITVADVLVHNCDEPGMPTDHAHYPTQGEAKNAALEDAGINPDHGLEVTNRYDGGSQMQAPRGEPWQTIRGLDDSGNIREIQYHNGHSFDDGTSFGAALQESEDGIPLLLGCGVNGSSPHRSAIGSRGIT